MLTLYCTFADMKCLTRNLLLLVLLCYAITSTIVYLTFLLKKYHYDFEQNHHLRSVSHIYKSLYRAIFSAKYTGCLKFGSNIDQNLARAKANPLFTDIAAFDPTIIEDLLRMPRKSQTYGREGKHRVFCTKITRQIKISWYPSAGCMGD